MEPLSNAERASLQAFNAWMALPDTDVLRYPGDREHEAWLAGARYARAAALEEAAKVCEGLARGWEYVAEDDTGYDAINRCAHAIRALIDTRSEQTSPAASRG